jgi:hypothetical protein
MNHSFVVVRNTANAGVCSLANSGSEPSATLLLPSATYMPELIALLRLGSMISGECAACHEVLLVKGSGTQTLGELSCMIRQAFLEHLQRRPDLQVN